MRPITAKEWPPLDPVPSLVGVTSTRVSLHSCFSVVVLVSLVLVFTMSFFSPPVQASTPESRGDHTDQSAFNMAARFWRRLPDSPLHCPGEMNVRGGEYSNQLRKRVTAESDLRVKLPPPPYLWDSLLSLPFAGPTF